MLSVSMLGTKPVPSIHDTAYPRLKGSLSPEELTIIYTPTPEEITFAEQITRNKVNQLSCLVLLKTFQRLGYAVLIASIPASIIRHVATILGQSISSQELSKYDGSNTRKRHLVAIREYLGLNRYDKAAQEVIEQVMKTTAQSKHDLVDIINLAIEELVCQRFELPAFSTLERAAKRIRMQVTQSCYQQVCEALEREDRIQINRLFLTDDQNEYTLWNELKQDPGQPTISKFQKLVERLNWLSTLQFGCKALANQ